MGSLELEGQLPEWLHRQCLSGCLQTEWHAPLAHRPRQKHSRRSSLHPVHGLRFRRRREGGADVQDGRRHHGRHRRSHREQHRGLPQHRGLRPDRTGVSDRVQRPDRQGHGTTNFVPARGVVGDWGDTYGNRVDRFTACVAYLDGQRPSAVSVAAITLGSCGSPGTGAAERSRSAGSSTAMPPATAPISARATTSLRLAMSTEAARIRSATAPAPSRAMAPAAMRPASAMATRCT